VNPGEVTLTLPPELIEAIAQRAAELVLERLGPEPTSPWMDRRRAAAYLGYPVSRLEKDKRIPVRRDGRRVIYNRADLDRFMASKLTTAGPRPILGASTDQSGPATLERPGP
jgi:hypothetical protein